MDGFGSGERIDRSLVCELEYDDQRLANGLLKQQAQITPKVVRAKILEHLSIAIE